MSIKKHDFLEVEYLGTLKGEGVLFDTTSEADAKKHNVYREGVRYGPLTVCVGEHFLLPGLDAYLIGKEVGKEYHVDLAPEEGFGKKDPKLIQMIPLNKFQESKIQPFPGLQINVDGQMGIVKTVGGGRVMIDFNHPLSGKELAYTITVKSAVTDEKKKVDSYLRHLGLDNLDITAENGVVNIALHMEMPQVISDQFTKRIKEIIPTIKDVKFTVNESAKGKKHEHGHDHGHEGHDHSHHVNDHGHHGHKH